MVISLLALLALVTIGCSNSLMESLLKDKNIPIGTPPRKLNSIEIDYSTVMRFIPYGGSLNIAGLVFVEKWSDGDIRLLYGVDFDDDDLELGSFDPRAEGVHPVSVLFREKVYSFDVTVGPPGFFGYEFDFSAIQKDYGYGKPLSLYGLIIHGIWEDAREDKRVYGSDFDDDDLTITAFGQDPEKLILTGPIIINYNGEPDSFIVIVAPPVYLSCEFDFSGVQKVYAYGDPFSLTYFKILETWEDGQHDALVYGIGFSDDDLTIAGVPALFTEDVTITITYKEYTEEFEITVKTPDGSAEYPFVITSDTLQNIGKSESGMSLSAHYKQFDDIDLSDEEWTPIGSSSTQFTGTYDGGGYGITNLTVTLKNNSGLFNTIGAGGIVRNINLVDTDIDVSTGNDGGAVAITNNGIIENCYVTGTIKGNKNFGGIVGTNNGTIRNCYVTADITGDAGNMGGIAGIANSSSKILNCVVTGNITNTGTNSDNIGGIAGANSGVIQYCVVLSSNITVIATNNPKYGRITGGSATSPNYARVDMKKNGSAITWNNSNGDDGTSITDTEYEDADWWKNTALFTDDWWWVDNKLPPVLP